MDEKNKNTDSKRPDDVPVPEYPTSEGDVERSDPKEQEENKQTRAQLEHDLGRQSASEKKEEEDFLRQAGVQVVPDETLPKKPAKEEKVAEGVSTTQEKKAPLEEKPTDLTKKTQPVKSTPVPQQPSQVPGKEIPPPLEKEGATIPNKPPQEEGVTSSAVAGEGFIPPDKKRPTQETQKQPNEQPVQPPPEKRPIPPTPQSAPKVPGRGTIPNIPENKEPAPKPPEPPKQPGPEGSLSDKRFPNYGKEKKRTSQKTEEQLARERNILLNPESGQKRTHPKDPLFASRVLEQERQPVLEEEQRVAEGREKVAAESKKEREAAAKKMEGGLERIKTFQSDMSRALKQKQTSVVQMMLSEHKKQTEKKEARSPTSKKNLPFVIISIVLILGGLALVGGGAYYFFGDDILGGPQDGDVDVPSIIFTEEKKELNITGLSERRLLGAIETELETLDIRLDFMEHLYFTEERVSVAEEETIKFLVSAQELFGKIETKMPRSLLRSLRPDFMYGIHSFNGNEPFIILKTDFFDTAFAGMLDWEDFMAGEIFDLFAMERDDVLLNKDFEDLVVKNKDLRVLLSENGEIVILYFFFDDETIIIAQSLDTMDEVISRLNRPNVGQ